jgi:predicted nucleotidyltransferase/DNA-binding HxlR family transcriptional regulator
MIDKASFEVLLLLRKEKTARFKDLKSIVKNSRTLSIKLKKLKKLNLIENSDKKYSLTEKGFEAAKKFEELNRILYSSSFKIENIERIPHMHLAFAIKKYCEILNKLLGDRLLSIMLFGSIARGDWNKNSDIDILVIAEEWEDKPVWIRIKELNKAKKELEESLEYLEAVKLGYWPIIQNYPLSVNEAKKFNRIFLDAIIDGIILYDKEKFLTRQLESLRKNLKEMGSIRVTLPNRKFYWVLKEVNPGEIIAFE